MLTNDKGGWPSPDRTGVHAFGALGASPTHEQLGRPASHFIESAEHGTAQTSHHIPHPVLAALVERDIPVNLTAEGYRVQEGFYKSGSVLLIPRWEGNTIADFTAVDRYDERSEIREFDDLVRLSFSWFELSIQRGAASWDAPAQGFVADYERLGLIERKAVTTFRPRSER